MAGEGATPDDLKIELQWPSDVSRDVPPVRLDPSNDDGFGDRDGSAIADDEPSARFESAPEPEPSHAATAAPTQEVAQQAARFARLAEETAATRARVDTLTDAVITMRSFLDERVGDVGDAVARSTTQLSSDLATALERMPTAAEVDIDGILEQSRTGLAIQLRDALAAAQGVLAEQLDQALVRLVPTGPDLKEQLAEVQEVVASSLQQAFAGLNGQVTRHLDEVIAESRAQTVERVERTIVETQDQLMAHLERLATSAQRASAEQDRVVLEELERSGATLDRLLTQAETSQAGLVRLDSDLATGLAAAAEAQSAGLTEMTEAMTGELASLAKGLATSVSRFAESVRADAQAGSDRSAADVDRMGNSVAGALNQVADRLERMARSSADSENVVEAVADALDELADRVEELEQSGRSRHDRLTAALGEVRAEVTSVGKADLRDVLDGVERLETGIAELTSAEERIGARLRADKRAGQETSTALTRLIEVGEQQTERLAELQRAGVPAMPRSLAALDKRVAELVRQQADQASSYRSALEGVADTVARLATAQAEDLEHIMDTIEARMDRPSADEAAAPLSAQLTDVAKQLEALRRRIPLRGRSPEMSDAAIDALADRLVDRMKAARAATSRPPRPQPPG